MKYLWAVICRCHADHIARKVARLIKRGSRLATFANKVLGVRAGK